MNNGIIISQNPSLLDDTFFEQPPARIESDCAKWADAASGELCLSVADMDFPLLPAITEAILQRMQHPFLGYDNIPDSYYESVLTWIENRHGYSPKREWLQYVPGLMTGFSLAIQALSEPGDGVVVQPPVYLPFRSIIQANQRQVIANPLRRVGDTYEMDFEDLRKKTAPAYVKLLLLCNPHNPIGRIWTQEELQTVLTICVENDVIVLSDEIHGEFAFEGHSFKAALSLPNPAQDHVIAGFAPSKTFGIPALRHGMLICPNPVLRHKLQVAASAIHLDSGCILGYHAAEAGFRFGGEWLSAVKKRIEGNYRYLGDVLKREAPEIRLADAQGTYFAWIDLSCLGATADIIEQKLKKIQLRLSSGFSLNDDYQTFRRMVLACPRSYVEEAARRLITCVREQRG